MDEVEVGEEVAGGQYAAFGAVAFERCGEGERALYAFDEVVELAAGDRAEFAGAEQQGASGARGEVAFALTALGQRGAIQLGDRHFGEERGGVDTRRPAAVVHAGEDEMFPRQVFRHRVWQQLNTRERVASGLVAFQRGGRARRFQPVEHHAARERVGAERDDGSRLVFEAIDERGPAELVPELLRPVDVLCEFVARIERAESREDVEAVVNERALLVSDPREQHLGIIGQHMVEGLAGKLLECVALVLRGGDGNHRAHRGETRRALVGDPPVQAIAIVVHPRRVAESVVVFDARRAEAGRHFTA